MIDETTGKAYVTPEIRERNWLRFFFHRAAAHMGPDFAAAYREIPVMYQRITGSRAPPVLPVGAKRAAIGETKFLNFFFVQADHSYGMKESVYDVIKREYLQLGMPPPWKHFLGYVSRRG